MSVVPASRCPQCGNADISEFARVEAGTDLSDHDIALYQCGACGAEFDSDDAPDGGGPP